jgi:hypothetical protein
VWVTRQRSRSGGVEVSALRRCRAARSKAERGYALAFDVVQPAAKAEPFGITREHVVDDVIALLVGACWHHLLKNHVVAEEGYDPERARQDARRLAPTANDLCVVPA